MYGEHYQNDFTELDDLDLAASEYAIAWADSDAKGRRALRDGLICRLVPFADRLASRYRRNTDQFEDIRQVARLGLVKSVDGYDPERGSFTAYALITITGEMKRHFRDGVWAAHVNRRLQELSIRVDQVTAELTHTLSRSPTVPEVARHLELGEEDVRNAYMCATARHPMSLNKPVGGDGTRELGDQIGLADTTLEGFADRMALDQLVGELPRPVQRMIILRFYGNQTQSQIGEACGLSQMHVSRLLRRGLAWLRVAMLSDAPPLWCAVDDYKPHAVTARTHRSRATIEVQVDG